MTIAKVVLLTFAALSMVLAGCLNLYETLGSYLLLIVLTGSALLGGEDDPVERPPSWNIYARWQGMRASAARALIHRGLSVRALVFLVVPALFFGWALVSLRLFWTGDIELVFRKLIQSTLDTLITVSFLMMLTIGFRLFPKSDDPEAPPLLQDIQPNRITVEEQAWKTAREETFYSEDLGLTVDNSIGTGLGLAAHRLLSVVFFQLRFALAGVLAYGLGLALRLLGDFELLSALDKWPRLGW